jgi:hypothetical protein
MCLAQSGRTGRSGVASNEPTTPPGSYLYRPSAKEERPSFDYLVGARVRRWRNRLAKKAPRERAECFGGTSNDCICDTIDK